MGEAFEWDDSKADRNFRKHGVGFADATDVFDDPLRTEWQDLRADYSEERFCTVGQAQGRLVFLVYTMRGERIRLIMARLASKREAGAYHGDREV